MQEKKPYNNKIKLKPVPLLDGIEEIKNDFEERIKQGDLKYGFEILDDYVETIRAGSLLYILARPNCLDLSTKILTDKGFKIVADLALTDKVVGVDGYSYDILDIVDTDEVYCYKLTTADGRSVISSDNHRWLIYNKKRRTNKIYTSEELYTYKLNYPDEFKRLSLPVFNRTKSQCMIADIVPIGKRRTRCPVTNAPANLIVVNDYLITMNTGKSLLGQIIACNIAKQGKKVLICSCEMGAGLIMERQLLNLTGTTNSQLKYMYEQHRDTANKIMDSIKENDNYEYLKNIDICETGGATVEDIMEMLDCFPEFDVIIVDYIQRIKGNGTEYENITNASRELQTYARRTRKPIIICSQAKRASEQGGKSSTSLENAGAAGKGSGSIEEDGDIGILISSLNEGNGREVLVTLFKNRYGYKDITYKYLMDNRLNFVLEQKKWVETKNEKKK